MTKEFISSPPWLDLRGAKEFAMDDAQLRELMTTFQDSLTQEMATIESGLARNEALVVEHSLHALKGFLALFAQPSLAQAVTDLYKSSRNQPLDVTRNTFESILPNLKALLSEVKDWLSRL